MSHVAAIHVSPGTWPEPVDAVEEVEAVAGMGLVGDRKFGARRQITVVSAEELEEAGRLLGAVIAPGSTRRQITISGVRLDRTVGTTIQLGEVLVEVSGDCAPCDEMNESVGPGARNALRGLAGITGTIATGGTIRVGDPVMVG